MKLEFGGLARLVLLTMAVALVPFTIPASGQNSTNGNQASSNSSGYHSPNGGNDTGSVAGESNHPAQAQRNVTSGGASNSGKDTANGPNTAANNPGPAGGRTQAAGNNTTAANTGGGGSGWGLWGLVGLIGLFGLAGRRPVTRVETRDRDENVRRIA